MAYEGKTYTRQEMDAMMEKHIQRNCEILRKNLREKSKKSELIEYV